jgi:hypothetical protein
MSLSSHRTTASALALVTAALLAPVASAQPIDGPVRQAARSTDQVPAPAAAREVRVAGVSTDAAFDWGDAGIGAGAALAVTMIGLGGLAVTARRREGAAA